MKLLQQELTEDSRYRESFKNVAIYGVTGTNGAGKDELMSLFADLGFLVYNTGDDLRQISHAVFATTQRGGKDTPMGRIANAERAIYPGGMVDLGLLDWWARANHLPEELRPKGLVIGSIRAVGEARRLQEFGGKLLLVDADPKIRYKRLVSRSRHYEKDITFEQFMLEDRNELAHGEKDPAKFSMAEVIKIADVTITNNSSDLKAFRRDARDSLGL